MRFIRTSCILTLFAPVILGGCGEKATTLRSSGPEPVIETARPVQEPPKPPESPKPKGATEDLQLAKPEIVMDAKSYDTKRLNDLDGFEKKLGDKVVEVNGIVASYDHSEDGKQVGLILEPRTLPFKCSDPKIMAKALPGQRVSLRCKGAGSGEYIWQVVRVDGDSHPAILADTIAMQFESDQEGTSKRYYKKHVVVSGIISRVQREKYNSTVFLATSVPGREIICRFGTIERDAAERHDWLKAGRTMRIVGQWNYTGPELELCVALRSDK